MIRVVNIFVAKLLSFRFLRGPGIRDSNGNPSTRHKFTSEDDLDVCSYYIQTLSHVLKYSHEPAIASLAKDKVLITNGSVAGFLKDCMFSINIDFTSRVY